jgi:hypothetical protein
MANQTVNKSIADHTGKEFDIVSVSPVMVIAMERLVLKVAS